MNWWRMTGSNRRPPACKAGALPAELIPQDLAILVVGLAGFEPATPALSRRCSNRLSYRPTRFVCVTPFVAPTSKASSPGSRFNSLTVVVSTADKCGRAELAYVDSTRSGCLGNLTVSSFSRKEVIQPHLPIRLPCYDFTPVTNPTVVSALLTVKLPTSGKTRSHGVTGGVYKTRERIHRDMLIRDY